MDIKAITQLFLDTKIVPLFYNGDSEIAKNLVDACYSGGARIIEFTNRGEKAKEVFVELLQHCETKYPDMIIGIGSICTAEQAEEYINIGAHFLVSPFIDKAIFDTCKKHQKFWTGGCATITEMNTAYKWGVPIMKAFPGNVLGPGFIKAAKAPCPWLQIMPTGGVKPTEENLTQWFNAGASCVGMGSQLFIKDENGNFNYSAITEAVRYSVSIASK